jgi:phosphoribosylformylglycinamidine synthase
MQFEAKITVMPIAEILDPQGKAVALGLANLGIANVEDVRVGKHIVLHLSADSQAIAEAAVDTACKKLLANLIMEDYSYTVQEVVLA